MGRSCWPLTVEPVIFLTFFSTTLVDVITQKYIYTTLTHKTDTSQEGFCEKVNCYNSSDLEHVGRGILCSSSTDYWLLFINLASLLLAIPSTIIFGTWSETEGRKIVLVASLLGIALRVALVFIIIHFQEPLYFFVIVSLMTSALGYSTSLMSSCMAYVADITSRGQRTFRILFLDSAAGIGIGLAYFVCGFYLERIWFYHLLWLGIAACIMNIIYIVFYLEESLLLPGFYGSSTIFSCQDFLEICRVFTHEPGNGRRWRLLTYVASFVVAGIIFTGTNSLLILHAQTSLCFSMVLTGYLAGALCLRYISSLVSVKLFQSVLKASNNWIIEAGLVSLFAGLILASLNTSTRLTFNGKFKLLLIFFHILSKHNSFWSTPLSGVDLGGGCAPPPLR